MKEERIVFIDWLKVIACLMVMIIHSCEPFYLGGEGTLILSRGDAFWVTLLDSVVRCAVPLFLIASGYLLFPLKYDTGTFFRKRLIRIVVPFVIWLLLYALIPLYGCREGFSIKENLHALLFNFSPTAGHLWFVYMLLGIYLIMPILSPWAQKVSRRELHFYLAVWLFTTLIPYFRTVAPAGILWAPEIGAPLWGEANWSEFGLFYYISGYVGYLLLGLYLKKFFPELSLNKTVIIGISLALAGFAMVAGWFWQSLPTHFPYNAPINEAVRFEIGWRYTSLGVALQTIGYFVLIRKIGANGKFYQAAIKPLAAAGYGTYLLHIFILVFYMAVFRSHMNTPLCILTVAGSTFVTASLVSILLQKIPYIGRYLVG